MLKANFLIQKATWKKAIMFTAIFALFYVFINFSDMGVAGLLRITSGANILDFEFGYSKEEAYRMLSALGEDGRIFYLTRILPLDFPFPFVYMLCFTGWIALMIKHITFKNWHKYLLLIPVLNMMFDWIENTGIIIMLSGYPDLPVWAVLLASVAGMIKIVFTFGNLLVICLLFIAFTVKRHADV